MRGKFLRIAALGLALVSAHGAFAASPAAAVDCRLLNLADEAVTGSLDTYYGAALGYVVAGNPGDNVTIRCYVTVNGTEVATTPTGGGVSVGISAGQLTYTASDSDVVMLCAETTTGGDSGTTCWETLNMQVPPQAVMDLAAAIADVIVAIYQPPADAVPCGGGVVGNCQTGGTCTVNFGSCTGGTCAVNFGSCNSGVCFINTGTCDGGTCFINIGTCATGGTCFVNGGWCGSRVDPR